MHPLNTNEVVKMKQISYFGKEYTVSDDAKWVATDVAGYIEIFKQKPSASTLGWVYPDGLLDKLPAGDIDWRNSLRKVEDILVKENKLKVGDKVMVNSDVYGFRKGQIVEVYELNNNGIHLFKGDNENFRFCDGEDGAYLWDYNYDIIEDTPIPSGHPHADLILKYAMIAQYDDKPWESFEVLLDGEWKPMDFAGMHSAFNYRLKPQEPKIQAGQVWSDKTGIIVSIRKYSAGIVFIDVSVGGLIIPWSYRREYFLNNFKLKENK